MTAFPDTLKIGTNSKEQPRDGRNVDLDGDGLARVRKLTPDRIDFAIELPKMTSTDRDTLFTFYNANLTQTFDFVWPPDGLTYQVKFGGRPALIDYKKGRYTYQFMLVAGG